MENRISIVVDAAAGPLDNTLRRLLQTTKTEAPFQLILVRLVGLRETITPSYREFTSRTSGSLE